MFEQTFVEATGKTRRSWTVLVSFVGQLVVVGALLLIPLIFTDALPSAALTMFITAPPPPPPPPPPAAAPTRMTKAPARQFNAGHLMEPKAIPPEIAMIQDEELPPPNSGAIGVQGGVEGGVPGGSLNGVIGSVLNAVPTAVPPPSPPPVKEPPKPTAIPRIPVGGLVQAAKLIRQPQPVYPPLARQTRISGAVTFTAVIGVDGRIQNLTLLNGHPLLVPAAQEAIKQWVYQPTLLNGEPVEVVTRIVFHFRLN